MSEYSDMMAGCERKDSVRKTSPRSEHSPIASLLRPDWPSFASTALKRSLARRSIMDESSFPTWAATREITRGPSWKWSPRRSTRPATGRSSERGTSVSGSVASPASSTMTCENQPPGAPVERSAFERWAEQMHVATTTLKPRTSDRGGMANSGCPSSPGTWWQNWRMPSGTVSKLRPTAFSRSIRALSSPSLASFAHRTSAPVFEGAATRIWRFTGRCWTRCHTMKAASVLFPVPGGPHTTSGCCAPASSVMATARRWVSFNDAGSACSTPLVSGHAGAGTSPSPAWGGAVSRMMLAACGVSSARCVASCWKRCGWNSTSKGPGVLASPAGAEKTTALALPPGWTLHQKVSPSALRTSSRVPRSIPPCSSGAAASSSEPSPSSARLSL
mmetsp:Transcript_96987/g.274682  ORF Transcript_96987/g.274682 Transcript_96987/m.274682 type:complete len:389 (-) Transcript_96987:250-1416(-)